MEWPQTDIDQEVEIANSLNLANSIKYIFTPVELREIAGSDVDDKVLEKSLACDGRFISLGYDIRSQEHFIAQKTLFNWFWYLSTRLARANEKKLHAQQIVKLLSFISESGQWNNIPEGFLSFGQEYSFIRMTCTPEYYVFPIAYLLSFIPESDWPYAYTTLEKCYLEQIRGHALSDLFHQSINSGIYSGNSRVTEIVIARMCLTGMRKMTLQQLANRYNLTRERIRQLENIFWKQLKKRRRYAPFIIALIYDVLRNRGSLLVNERSPDIRARLFVAEALGIPQSKFPGSDFCIIGVAQANLPDLKSLTWIERIDETAVTNFLESSATLYLVKHDIELLAQNIVRLRLVKTTPMQKVYLALKTLGRPSHFSEVAEMRNSMFPEGLASERSVHGLLGREELGIVWIGVKGTFALKEWGYEHPSMTLFETVTQIVKERFQHTGKTVPLEVITSELGKYRRVVKPASIIIATGCNPALEQVSKNNFIPRSCPTEPEYELTGVELDKILKEFEQELKNKSK